MVYAEKDPVMGDVADICMGLNSFLGNRLDEPDRSRTGQLGRRKARPLSPSVLVPTAKIGPTTPHYMSRGTQQDSCLTSDPYLLRSPVRVLAQNKRVT